MDLREIGKTIAAGAVGVAGVVGGTAVANEILETERRVQIVDEDLSEFCEAPRSDHFADVARTQIESTRVGNAVSSVALQRCDFGEQFVVTIDDADGSYTITSPVSEISLLARRVDHAKKVVDYVDRDSLPDALIMPAEQFGTSEDHTDPQVRWAIAALSGLVVGAFGFITAKEGLDRLVRRLQTQARLRESVAKTRIKPFEIPPRTGPQPTRRGVVRVPSSTIESATAAKASDVNDSNNDSCD